MMRQNNEEVLIKQELVKIAGWGLVKLQAY